MASQTALPMPPWRRMAMLSTGVACLIVGTLWYISPLPGGFLIIGSGAGLVLGNSRMARRRFIELKKRYPQWMRPVRNLLRRRRQGSAPTTKDGKQDAGSIAKLERSKSGPRCA
ncbi:MAG: hypothetical protein ACFB6S_17130 [Geminicoccaceae bacterium]